MRSGGPTGGAHPDKRLWLGPPLSRGRCPQGSPDQYLDEGGGEAVAEGRLRGEGVGTSGPEG